MRPFDYQEPHQIKEAISTLSEYGSDAALLAGGTDLLIMLKSGAFNPKIVINLKKIPGLQGMDNQNGGIRLGALTTIRAIETSLHISEHYPALVEAANHLGSIQIRHLATIGGNICRAAPCSETAPVLMVLGAQARLIGAEGERTIPLDQFFTGPGQTALAPDEILIEVDIPEQAQGSGAAYLRHSIRPLMDLAIINVAASVTLAGDRKSFSDIQIVLGSVAPTPIHARSAEAAMRGQPISEGVLDQAAALAAEESQPITDVRGTDEYRRSMVELFTKRALNRAIKRATG